MNCSRWKRFFDFLRRMSSMRFVADAVSPYLSWLKRVAAVVVVALSRFYFSSTAFFRG